MFIYCFKIAVIFVLNVNRRNKNLRASTASPRFETFYPSVRGQCRVPLPTQLITEEKVLNYYNIYNLTFDIQAAVVPVRSRLQFSTQRLTILAETFWGGLIIFSIRSEITVQMRPRPIFFHLPYSLLLLVFVALQPIVVAFSQPGSGL